MYAYWGDLEMLKKLQGEATAPFVVKEATRRFNVKLRSLDKSRFAEEIRMFLSLYNQAFQSHWGFVPLSEAEVVRISSELKHLIVPEFTTVAEVDGKPVGCVFGCQITIRGSRKSMAGCFRPGSFACFGTVVRFPASADHRGQCGAGVPAVGHRFGAAARDSAPPHSKWGLQEAEFSWVMESNRLSWRMADVAVRSYKNLPPV